MTDDQNDIILQKQKIKTAIQSYQAKIKALVEDYERLDRKQQFRKQQRGDSPLKLKALLSKEQEVFLHQRRNKVTWPCHGIEPFTQLRLYHLTPNFDDWETNSSKHRFLEVNEFVRAMNGGDDIEDSWFTVGILHHKSNIFTNEKEDTSFQCLSLTDLKGNGFRLFLCDKMAEEPFMEDEGSVLAIRNAEIKIPSESSGEIGLLLNNPSLILKLGKATDFNFCYNEKSICNQVIDTRQGFYCDVHRLENYKTARLKRPEFATGNGQVVEGPPKDKNIKKAPERLHKNNATYRIGTNVIVACGPKVFVRSTLKPLVQKANEQEINAMMNLHTPAAENLRLIFGQKKRDKGNTQIFGDNALLKMGFNPFACDETVPKGKDTTPVKRKAANDSSDCELEIEPDEQPALKKRQSASAKRVSPKKSENQASTRKATSDSSDYELEIEPDKELTLKKRQNDSPKRVAKKSEKLSNIQKATSNSSDYELEIEPDKLPDIKKQQSYSAKKVQSKSTAKRPVADIDSSDLELEIN